MALRIFKSSHPFRVLQWKKNLGDVVKKGDTVIIGEFDKVVIDVSLDDQGILKEKYVCPGDEVKKDQKIFALK